MNPKSPKNGKTGGKVLAGRGDRTIYTVSGNGEKECVTVLMAANAAGMKAPPMIVYKYERIPEEIAKSVPKGWGIRRSPKSGWMFSCLFYEWVTNVFEPWLTTNSIERPAFLFLDGHQSHLTMELSDFCVEKQIEIIPLYPNATHIMQPLDVAVFKPLKDKWKKLVRNWRFDHAGERLLKTDFPALLSTALDEVTDDVVRSGFVATGLCPFNPDVIDFSNLILPHNKFDDTCSSNDTSTVSNNCSLSATSTVNGSSMESHITALESNISPCKLERFKQCSNDESIPIEDKSLYKVWKRLKSNASTDISDTLSPGTLNASHNQSLAQFSEDILPENESTPPSEYRPPPKNCPPADIPSPFKDALRWPTLQKKNAGKKKKKDFPLAITSDAWRNHHKKVQQEKSQKEKEKEEKKSLRLQKKQLNDQKKKLNGQKRMLKEQKKKNVKRKLTYVSEDTDNDDSVTSWVESSDSSEYEKSFDEEEMAAYAKKRSMKNDKTPKQPKDSFMKEVKVGQWVIVRFKMSQQAGRTRKFIGQIDGVQNGKLIGNFVRPASTKKNFGYVYKFPEKLDKTSFSFLQVEKILLNPKPYGRYGLLLFQVNAKDL